MKRINQPVLLNYTYRDSTVLFSHRFVVYVRHQVRRQVVTLLRVSSEGTQAAYTTRDCSVRSGPFRENLKDAVKVKDNTYNVPSMFNGK